MKFSTKKPPNWEMLEDFFNVNWEDGIAVAYGDTIYSRYPLPDHLIVHETIHLEEQAKIGVDEWWQKYFKSGQFRLEQEILAYKAQVKFIKSTPQYKHRAFMMSLQLAEDLSGQMYGYLCTRSQAMKYISS